MRWKVIVSSKRLRRRSAGDNDVGQGGLPVTKLWVPGTYISWKRMFERSSALEASLRSIIVSMADFFLSPQNHSVCVVVWW